MLIRVFRGTAKPGKEDEYAELVRTVSIPFIEQQPGLIACYTGRGIGLNADEIVMVSIWKDIEALKGMTGENWEAEVIPDQAEVERIETCSVAHYRALE